MANPNEYQYTMSANRAYGTIKLDLRRIIIKKLPPAVTERDIRELIRKRTSFKEANVKAVEFPSPSLSGKPKAYVFVVMDTVDNAKVLTMKLDKSKFKKKELEVMVAKKDGVNPLTESSQAALQAGMQMGQSQYAFGSGDYTHGEYHQVYSHDERPVMYWDEGGASIQATSEPSISSPEQKAKISSKPPPVVNGSRSV